MRGALPVLKAATNNKAACSLQAVSCQRDSNGWPIGGRSVQGYLFKCADEEGVYYQFVVCHDRVWRAVGGLYEGTRPQ
ncbi:MAG: hypothetical protein QXP98_05050 [Thermoproteus sp.]